MNVKDFDARYGKIVFIAASLLIWGFIIWSFFHNGYVNTWYFWHIPAKMPPFIDFRLIPSSAEALRLGFDPTISNPTDPRGHIFNYPKIWYLFRYTGITQGDTIWVSVTLIILLFLVVFAFPEKMRVRDVFIMLAITFSPASMLLYERGNVDNIMFILSGVAILTVHQMPFIAASAVILGSFLKFFPFFTVIVFLGEDKKNFFKWFLGILTLFLIYIALNWQDIVISWTLTERGSIFSYGVYVIFEQYETYVRYYLLRVVSEGHVKLAATILPHLSIFILSLGVAYLALKKHLTLTVTSERNFTAFWVGAAVYVGTFLLGNNWDYRLTFLIFTIPQLVQWQSAAPVKSRWLYWGIFTVMLASCWSMPITNYYIRAYDNEYDLRIKTFDEIMNWGLYIGLLYLLVASAPNWVKNIFTQRHPPLIIE